MPPKSTRSANFAIISKNYGPANLNNEEPMRSEVSRELRPLAEAGFAFVLGHSGRLCSLGATRAAPPPEVRALSLRGG